MIFTDIKKHASAFGIAVIVGLILYLVSLNGTDQSKTEQNMVSPTDIVQEGESK